MKQSAATTAILRATLLGVRIAVAESLTGGLLASALIEVSGASQVVSGGIVAYDTRLKSKLLDVSVELLSRVGPVDGEVACQMAAGVRRTCALPVPSGQEPLTPSFLDHPADIGLSTTGVAGPDPDPQSGQPAGTVWIGVSSSLGERAVPLLLVGTRSEIRTAAVVAAVHELEAEIELLEQFHADSSGPQE